MRISLVCPKNVYGESATSGVYYPMGILLIGSSVKRELGYNVEVLDGELYTDSELEEKIKDSDVVGLSANTDNYLNCLNLARFAHTRGSKVVVGGPHTSAVLRAKDKQVPMAELILKNRKEIDAIIVYEGEKAFLEYLTESQRDKPNYGNIENLFWRDENGDVRGNKSELPTQPPLVSAMDFSLMNLERYWNEHNEVFPKMDKRFIEGFTHIGCRWREVLGCSFCDIPYPTNVYQKPETFWSDLGAVKGKFGISSFKDYGDCLTGNIEAVKALLKTRPSDLQDVEFSCYGRSVEITGEMSDLLHELNVRYVYIGFDSGSNKMLGRMREGYGVRANHTAIENLARNGINITGSLILGAEGESEDTIRETEEFARRANNYDNVTAMSCSILTPFPGSPMSSEFLRDNPEYFSRDIWNSEQTTRLWIEKRGEAPYEYIEDKARGINSLNLSSRKRYFGFKRS